MSKNKHKHKGPKKEEKQTAEQIIVDSAESPPQKMGSKEFEREMEKLWVNNLQSSS